MPENRPVVVAVQMDIAWKDKAANHAKVRTLLEAEPPPAGSLFVLPEMFATGFCMDVAEIAETDAPCTEPFVAELAQEFGVFVAAGVVTRVPDGRGSNDLLVVDPSGEEVCRYRKIQPFAGDERANYA